jgi:hypothetical protein
MSRGAVALCLLAALGGCASVPEATPGRDAEAKQFETRAGAAAVYVFRNDFPSTVKLEDSVLYVDGRLIGATLPGTFFRLDVMPGVHELHGYGYDAGSLKIRAREGEAHFVALNVVDGTSRFAPVAPARAQREIERCCVLLENWTPGQRPLLR